MGLLQYPLNKNLGSVKIVAKLKIFYQIAKIKKITTKLQIFYCIANVKNLLGCWLLVGGIFLVNKNQNFQCYFWFVTSSSIVIINDPFPSYCVTFIWCVVFTIQLLLVRGQPPIPTSTSLGSLSPNINTLILDFSFIMFLCARIIDITYLSRIQPFLSLSWYNNRFLKQFVFNGTPKVSTEGASVGNLFLKGGKVILFYP